MSVISEEDVLVKAEEMMGRYYAGAHMCTHCHHVPGDHAFPSGACLFQAGTSYLGEFIGWDRMLYNARDRARRLLEMRFARGEGHK